MTAAGPEAADGGVMGVPATIDVSVSHVLACESLDELVEICREGGAIEAAMRKSGRFAGTPDYYKLARIVLWAEWQAGHQLRLVERRAGPGRGHTEKISHAGNSFLSLLDSYNLKKNTAYRWINMSFAPREEMEKYMETQRATGRPVIRANLVKIGEDNRPPVIPTRKTGAIQLPEGQTAEAVCRKGMEIEALTGKVPREVAVEIGIRAAAYRSIRYMILLAENDDLSPRDRLRAQTALEYLNESAQLKSAFSMIEHLADRVWGATRGSSPPHQTSARRVREFDGAMGLIIQMCAGARDIEIPQLAFKPAMKAVGDLQRAIATLRGFTKKIEEQHL